jgi:hypothetical protein
MIINAILLDNAMNLEINTFDDLHKDAIIKHVIELSKNTILDGMTQNYSAEGGFNLPLTYDWREAIRKQNSKAYQYIDYHHSREFRFKSESNQINGLYTKNSMKWWTTREKYLFRDIINISIHKILNDFLS